MVKTLRIHLCFVWLLALPAIRHVEAATLDCVSFHSKRPRSQCKAHRTAGRETGRLCDAS